MNKDEITKKLKSSPIYNMSQDSLENFHTSFLCWLLNTYPEFTKLFTSNTNFLSCKKQQSHGNNIRTDLEIELNNKEIIIIENKLKSFPNNEQLEKYSAFFSKKYKTTSFVLLSLVQKENLPNNWDKWEHKSYSELAKKMQRIFKRIKYKEPYHKDLIQDYISVINLLSKSFPQKNKETYDLYEQKQQIVDDLQDIYIKYRTSEFANYINKKINKKYNWEIKEGFSTKCKEGLVDVIRKLDENNRFQIQIQGKHYSYGFVYLENKSDEKTWKDRINIAGKLNEKNYWFIDTENPKGKTKHDNFHSYDDFIYRHSKKRLDKSPTYKEIINRINKDIEIFEKNLNKIKRLIYK